MKITSIRIAAGAEPMSVLRLQEILERFGTDPNRWPEGERNAARALIARSEAARSRYLDETLADLTGRAGRGS